MSLSSPSLLLVFLSFPFFSVVFFYLFLKWAVSFRLYSIDTLMRVALSFLLAIFSFLPAFLPYFLLYYVRLDGVTL